MTGANEDDVDENPANTEQLRVQLEDAASRKWWARILYTLGSQYGSTQFRFVGKADDGRWLYVSETFPAPPLNRTPPEEQWAPGLQASLRQLHRDISRDGWQLSARGKQPWDLTFSRAKS
ncbi:hypothetical protein [Pseudarthrobacter sp. efr-133-R2A-89]|uniref:hypothetical protein n=1 Tax=Pseudarthrobacter sp. efr-133-R2A-89 TaxID=3040302 RepID=UPI002556829E|nr:hypothetical protein [Pseudarthrobacter sp. efr-133-R2A-89]